MLPRTFRNRCYLVIVNITMFYLFNALTIVGLLPIKRSKRKGIVNVRWVTIYSIVCCCLVTGLYLWVILSLIQDPNINSFFSGVGRITFSLLYFFSLTLIATFYIIAIRNRFRLQRFYDSTLKSYPRYAPFYTGKFGPGVLTFEHVESEEELVFVYFRLFIKVVLIHFLVIFCILGVSERGSSVGGVSYFKFLGFFLLPYIVKSLTSSFMYLGGARSSFLLYKLSIKLKELRNELRELTRSKKSHYEKMSKYCEISDLIDELAMCYETINDTANELLSMNKFQIGMVLMFSVINTLHGMFSQYQVISYSISRILPLDIQLFAFNVLFIFFNILEILMVVNITDSCHMNSIRVGKTIQSLTYFVDLDIRLRRSVRYNWYS